MTGERKTDISGFDIKWPIQAFRVQPWITLLGGPQEVLCIQSIPSAHYLGKWIMAYFRCNRKIMLSCEYLFLPVMTQGPVSFM